MTLPTMQLANGLFISLKLQDYVLPDNVSATTSMEQAISGAQYAIHAVPVQHSRVFLESIKVSTSLAARYRAQSHASWSTAMPLNH